MMLGARQTLRRCLNNIHLYGLRKVGLPRARTALSPQLAQAIIASQQNTGHQWDDADQHQLQLWHFGNQEIFCSHKS